MVGAHRLCRGETESGEGEVNPSYVPSRLIQPLVIDWLTRRGMSVPDQPIGRQPYVGAQNILAELSGVSVRTVRVIIAAERPNVEYQCAEKLLMAMDQPEAWHHGELGQWYADTRLWKRGQPA